MVTPLHGMLSKWTYAPILIAKDPETQAQRYFCNLCIQEADGEHMVSVIPSTFNYSSCFNKVIVETTGFKEKTTFVSGENICTTINIEKYFEQVADFGKFRKGDVVIYTQDDKNLSIKHLAKVVSVDTGKLLVESQFGNEQFIRTHRVSSVRTYYGGCYGVFRLKKDYENDEYRLARMTYDNEIAHLNQLKNREEYQKALKTYRERSNNEAKEALSKTALFFDHTS